MPGSYSGRSLLQAGSKELNVLLMSNSLAVPNVFAAVTECRFSRRLCGRL
jgi:hypothetical protein